MKWALLAAVVVASGCTRASRESKAGVEVLGTTAALPPHAVEEPVAGTERIAGKVVDESGSPVGGAVVRAHIGRHITTTTSGVNGSFAFEGLPRRGIMLSGGKDDLYAPHVGVTPGVDRDPVTMRLVRGCTVTVHVIDAQSRAAIANAEVEIEPLTARTGADGVASVRGVRPDRLGYVAVHADGYAAGSLPIELQDEPGAVIDETVELTHGAEVRGVVRGPGGALVAGAKVSYVRGIERARNDDLTSGPDGTWRYSALRAGTYIFSASGGGYADAEVAAISLDGKTPRSDLFIAMQVGAQIAGEVRDASGNTVAGAQVIVRGRGIHGDSAVTDDQGRFEIFGLTPVAVEVYATRGDDASPIGDVTLDANRRTLLRIGMVGAAIEGTAVDDSGKPVPGARIELSGHKRAESFAWAIADGSGHFTLRGSPAGSYELWATRGNVVRSAEAKLKRTTVATGMHDLTLHIAPEATITGRVLLDGRPVHDFAVISTYSPLPVPRGVSHAFHGGDGAFTVVDVGDGPRTLVITGPEFARKTVEIGLTGGKVTAVGDIVVDRGTDVHGRVTDAHGPVAGATVTINDLIPRLSFVAQKQAMDYAATTATDGTYTITHVAPPAIPTIPLHIEARVPGRGVSQPHILGPGESAVDLALDVPGAIDGVVSNHTPFTLVFAQRGKQHIASAAVDSNGAFSFPELAPGDYTLQAITSPTGEPAAGTPVKVTSGAHTQVQLD
jgi:hypothetical protein